ncbi:hypothetical protein FOZ63_025106, partial [Perkinsus olseni]
TMEMYRSFACFLGEQLLSTIERQLHIPPSRHQSTAQQVRLLLQYPGVDVDSYTAEGETAAFLVIPHRCDILPLLLDAGANPVEGWRWRKSPLQKAVVLGSLACLQHLSRSSVISLDTYPNH